FCLRRKRVPQTQRPNFLRQVEFVAVIDWTHRLCAANEKRSRARAVTCLARALLFVDLFLRAIDFAPGQHFVCARAALSELPYDNTLNKIGARFETEDFVLELDLALRLVVETEKLCLHDQPSAFSEAGASGCARTRSGFRTDPGIGASLGRGCLTASRTI